MTNDKALHFNIKFEDLGFEKQEAIIKALKPRLQAAAKIEGEEFLARDWNEPKPKTWQEAYVRTYDLDRHMWEGYVNGKASEIPAFMWETWQEDAVEEQARVKATESFSLSEIEVIL